MNHTGLIGLSVVGAGAWLLPSRWVLPPDVLIILLLAVSVVAIAAARWLNTARSVGLVLFCLGGVVSVWQLDSALQHRVPDVRFGDDISAVVKVVSVIDQRPQRQIIIADTVSAPSTIKARRWRIAWYGIPTHANGKKIDLAVGDVWELTLRLRGLSGLGNPGGFDVAAWYLRTHIDGTAYVRNEPFPVRLKQGGERSINAWRAATSQRVLDLLPNDRFDAVVVALTLGFRAGIEEQFRKLLVVTGTAHLLAISGLHIGLVSAAIFFALKGLWRMLPDTIGSRYSRSAFASIFSVAAAIVYAVLAGFSPPTIRAVGMCAVGFFLVWQKRSLSPWTPFLVTLTFVVLTDVLRLLSPGVWLSFGTVALIVILHRPNTPRQRFPYSVVTVLRTHTALAICLLPITGWFFAQGSLVAPIANTVAVPLVSVFVVPISLAVVLLVEVAPVWATYCLALANLLIEYLEKWLTICASFSFANAPVTVPSFVTLIAALAGVICLCLPKEFGVRAFAVALCAPVLVWSFGERDVHGIELHVLDVGQGHASLLFTKHHVVLIDTGASLGNGQTHWEATLFPALKRLGRSNVSHIVISHSDADHAAGAEQVANQFPQAKIWLGGVAAVSSQHPAMRCQAGQSWRLDGVEFSFLHPSISDVEPELIGQNVDDNDQSCVLLVQFGSSTILFPGDIEQRAEQQLLSRLLPIELVKNRANHVGDTINSSSLALSEPLTIMVAPHHGSSTSSSDSFIDAWVPEHVVFPAGYRNRLGFPHDAVRMGYNSRGSESYVTGRDGAVRFQLGPAGLLSAPTRYWVSNRRLWHPLNRYGDDHF